MAERNLHAALAPRGRRWLPLVVASASFALLAAACGDDDGETSAEAGGDGDGLNIAIVDPADGADVGESFDVQLDTSVPLGEPDTGRHHVHLYYDGETAEGTYDLVYGDSFTVTRLDPGEHSIEAVIANADHSLTDARQEITVNVGEGAGAASETDATPTSEAEAPAETEMPADPYGY